MFNKIQKIRLTLMSVVVASVTMLVSCDKNGLAPETNGTQPSSARIIPVSDEVPVPKFNGKMYEFESEEAFVAKRQQLEDSYNAYMKAYVGGLSARGLNEDQIDETSVNEKFDINKPITDFDNKIAGFVSARESIEPEFQKWMQNDNLDFATNPYAKVAVDQFSAALLNVNGEATIAGKVVNFKEAPAGEARLRICLPTITSRSGSWYSGSSFRIFGDMHVGAVAVAATTYPQFKLFRRWWPSLRNVCASTSGVGYGLFCKQKDASASQRCFWGITGVAKWTGLIQVRAGELKSFHSCPSKGVSGSLSI